MEKEFIPYEQALALKELGFDEPCFAKYYQQDGNTPFIQIGESEIEEAESAGNDVTFECDAPLYQQAFRWFRENHKLSCSIELTDNSRGYYYDFTIYDSKNRDWNDEDCFDSCKNIYSKEKHRNYEEAERECLKKLIEAVKDKQ